MTKGNKDIIRLLGKKYTYEMLLSLEKGPKRFKALADACGVEKMRVQRLRELESLDMIKVRARRLDGRSVSIYSISEKGRKIAKLAEDIRKLEPVN
jgi:DNA-binding HxlR family transcriptional regulator